MANIFAGSEIVELGVQIEMNGYDFYNELAFKSKDKKIKDLFNFLAQEEQKHIKVFQEILDKAEKYEPPEAYTQEYFSYMKALADNYVFTQKGIGARIAKEIKSDTQAVNMGITFEKDSIIFYDGIKKAVPEYDHKIVDQLIAQERNHIIKLLEIRKKG